MVPPSMVVLSLNMGQVLGSILVLMTALKETVTPDKDSYCTSEEGRRTGERI